MKILAFGASNSTTSINKKLATYAASLIQSENIEILDLNDYEMSLYSTQKEAELGQPEAALNFLNKISESDLVIISFAEHNGSYSVAFKNIFDWSSRINQQVFQGKNVLLLATSPGGRGASSVLEIAKNTLPFYGAQVIGTFSLPEFYNNFSDEKGIIDEQKREEFNSLIDSVK